MTGPDRRGGGSRIAAKIGTGVAAFTVFTAGWVAMKSSDWKLITAVTVLAAVAGIVAANLSARSR